MIEELSILRADALTVHDPGPRRRTIKVIIFLVIFLFFGWIALVYSGIGFYYRHASHGPISPIWNDPYLPHILRFSTLLIAVDMLVILPMAWFTYMIPQGYGVRVFRLPRTMKMGRWSGQVLSVTLGTRPQAAWGKTFYVVTISVARQVRPRWDRLEPTYRFQSLGNAGRFAALLAEFLDVPLTRLA